MNIPEIDPIDEFLIDEELGDISRSIEEILNESHEPGFNIFTLTSDLYYRENYHSDILAAFLNPLGKHNEGNRFLDAFIEMLNVEIKKSNIAKLIRKDYYTDALVKREHHKIDIFISTTKLEKQRCIIIENKMNNARDMKDQLPRYYERAIDDGLEVDAIVYIPLNIKKTVDQFTWNNDNIATLAQLRKLLINIPAYDSKEGNTNLVANWIEPLINSISNIDNISILRQYAELIKSLTPQMTLYSNMNKLYQYIIKNDNVKFQAKRFLSMMNNLPETLATNLINRINANNYKDQRVRAHQWQGQNNNCVIDFEKNNKYAQIYIYTSLDPEETYVVNIRENYDWVTDEIRSEFEIQSNGTLTRTFAFGEDDEVIREINRIIEFKP